MFTYSQNFDSGSLRSLIQLNEQPKYLNGKLFPQNSVFFEFETKFDNEGTTQEVQSKSYFNFIMRRAPQQGSQPFQQFIEQVTDYQPEFFNLVFICLNPPKLARLVTNQHRCVYRQFKNVNIVPEFMDILPSVLEQELKVIPDPYDTKFNTTSIVECVKDGEQEFALYQFQITNSTELIQFSYCYPYSFGQVLQSAHKKFPKRYYDITNSPIFNLPLRVFEYYSEEEQNQEYIIITCRTHPGESLQSYVLNQMIEMINANGGYKGTTLLYIPCVNPDGVYKGNYRVDCLGHNLNRMYNQDGEEYKINLAINQLVQNIQQDHKIRMILDLHNHATIQTMVCFGNDLVGEQLSKTGYKSVHIMQHMQQRNKLKVIQKKSVSTPQVLKPHLDIVVQELTDALEKQKLNLKFPYFLQKSELFSAYKSDFSFESMGKEDTKGEPIEGTLRVQMLKRFGITNVYTIEFNYSINNGRKVQTINYLFFKQVAEALVSAITDFLLGKEVTGMRSFCLVTSLQKELWEK
ncbi:Conserved_hypothetical protein [Hexamita inflata]|uniref:Peptidase M14 domain-containing protein n=1 Tax=Hexamita inflata TaxID=28002 RepID=A0AA86NYE3_9EUKA|nr:Conserved hypothetical protein [Hexamita inflata]